jgi:hypothetical protein
MHSRFCGRNFQHSIETISHLFNRNLLALFVASAHAADISGEMSFGDEFGENSLVNRSRV